MEQIKTRFIQQENTRGKKEVYMQELHISVRNLVEFIFRAGDIDNRAGKLASAEAMMEGSRIHRKIQKSMDTSYQAEVPLKIEWKANDYVLVVEGRADGIAYGKFQPDLPAATESVLQPEMEFATEIPPEEEISFIDEIKGVYRNVAAMEQPVYVHKAQAMCYAYIYAKQNRLERIGVQMTYCNLDTEEIRYFREIFDYETLTVWFGHLIEDYRKWADWQIAWKKQRQESIHGLEFPFPYREGQKKLVADVYRTILRGKNLFIEAPTGVGKTISTIFPAVKAVGEGLADLGILCEKGYRAKSVQITAKEKLCLCEEMDCNPVNCPYAKGHFDRVNDAVFDLLQKSNLFTREEVLAQAKEYQVCPFEMSLDVATWADNIVCDYNYVQCRSVQRRRACSEADHESAQPYDLPYPGQMQQSHAGNET